uniref:Uncharacterized protein n=1 Tax=Arundo donax TaxID=35708 RepID=A0A0A9AHM1_ARUDO
MAWNSLLLPTVSLGEGTTSEFIVHKSALINMHSSSRSSALVTV